MKFRGSVKKYYTKYYTPLYVAKLKINKWKSASRVIKGFKKDIDLEDCYPLIKERLFHEALGRFQ